MNTTTHSSASHPPSLRIFFATEMWERYGFYVVQTLLALFLAFHFRWGDKAVYTLVSTFTAITYLSPIVGGWIADNLLGQKNTIITGAVCLFFSYVSLSFISSDLGLIISLAAIAVGTGLLKPNISSLLGNEYPPDSQKREKGFIIFYLGITTGIILGTTLPSYIEANLGWSFAFLSAAFGMILAIFVFLIGVKHYRIQDYHPFKHSLNKIMIAAALIFMLWGICFYTLYNPEFADVFFCIVVFLAFGYLTITARQESDIQRSKTIVIGFLFFMSALFWAFYFQMFSSLTLFISRIVDPKLFGFFFPAPYYVAIQSLGMLVFGSFLASSRAKEKASQTGIQTGNKFLMSIGFMLLAYGLIVYSCTATDPSFLISPLLLIPAYLLFSIAELLLSPVGLSAITTLASRHKVSTMMGIFFVSLGIGAFLSGKLAFLTALPNHKGMSIPDLKTHYLHAFTDLFFILCAATLLCVGLNYMIKKLLAEKTD